MSSNSRDTVDADASAQAQQEQQQEQQQQQQSNQHQNKKRAGDVVAKEEAQDAKKRDDPLSVYFSVLAADYDAYNDLREKVINMTRSITRSSKKVISLLQRTTGEPTSDNAVFKQAEDGLVAVRGELQQLADALQGHDYWRYQKQFSGALQEYVEAAVFYHYLVHGALLDHDELAATLPLAIGLEDYLGGLADVTGELMRVVVTRAGVGGAAHCSLSRVLLGQFARLATKNRELSKKTDVMRQSVMKMERICFDLQLKNEDKNSVTSSFSRDDDQRPVDED